MSAPSAGVPDECSVYVSLQTDRKFVGQILQKVLTQTNAQLANSQSSQPALCVLGFL